MDTGLAVGAKSREIQMEKTGAKAADFYRPGEGLPLPGDGVRETN